MESGDPDYPRATCNLFNISDDINEDQNRKKDIMTAVCTAAWNSNLNVLERLVEQEQQFEKSRIIHATSQPSTDIVSPSGFGPLHFAASLGNMEIITQLLDNNIGNKNSRDKDGNTPLMWVVASDGSEELMEAFIDHGADINAQNFVGETALFVACSRGFTEKVELLLENGARTQISNLDGASPLHVACAGGHSDVVSLLIQYGAFLNVGDDEEDTPVHWAVREGHEEIIKLLISSGAEINCANGDGETPLGLAIALESQEIVACLLGLGGKETGVSVSAIKGGPVAVKYADVEVMDVEMKGLSMCAMDETCDNDGKIFQKEKSNNRFGTTPPAVSFAF